MPLVRFAASFLTGVLVAVLAGCSGSSRHAAPPPAPSASQAAIARAGETTIAEGTAHFTLAVSGDVGGLGMRADERGSVAFVQPRAHIYKLLLSGGIPEEVIVDGPYVYTNGNVQAAMNDTTVKPWTKLDTRRLTGKQRASTGDELAHVRAPAYLIEGVAALRRVGVGPGGVVHVQGMVDPARLASRLPPLVRASIVAAVDRDYTRASFPADFWIDPQGRVRRVHVSYPTGSSGRIVLTATYSNFGSPVALGLPPASHTQDITP
jgi:hypothetical protein